MKRYIAALIASAGIIFSSAQALADTRYLNRQESDELINAMVEEIEGLERTIGLSSGSTKVRRNMYSRYDNMVSELNRVFREFEVSGSRYRLDDMRTLRALSDLNYALDSFRNSYSVRGMSRKDLLTLDDKSDNIRQAQMDLAALVEGAPYADGRPIYPIYPPDPSNGTIYTDFNSLYNAVSRMKDDSSRVRAIMDGMQQIRLNTRQLIALMQLVGSDNLRMDIAYNGYAHLIDANTDWYAIYDTFNYNDSFDSNMARRYPGYRRPVRNPQGGYYVQPKPIQPSVGQVMSAAHFNNLYQSIQSVASNADRLRILRNGIGQLYLSADQLATFAKSLAHEQSKIDLVVEFYPNVSDKTNWYRIYDAFTLSSSRQEIDRRLSNHYQGLQVNPNLPIANSYPRLPNDQYQNVLAAVSRANFEEDKKRIIRSATSSYAISVNQLISIIRHLNLNASRVEIAAELHPRVYDKENWFQVYNAIEMSTDRARLEQMIK